MEKKFSFILFVILALSHLGLAKNNQNDRTYASTVSKVYQLLSSAIKIVNAVETNTEAEEEKALKDLVQLVSEIKRHLNMLANETIATKKDILLLEKQIYLLDQVLNEEPPESTNKDTPKSLERRLFEIKAVLFSFNISFDATNHEIVSSAFLEIDKHSLSLDFPREADLIAEEDKKRLSDFFKEKEDEKFFGRVTLFFWSPHDLKKGKSLEYLKKIEIFLREKFLVTDIKKINMKEKSGFWSWISDNEEYHIKKAYNSRSFDDTREEALGWFLRVSHKEGSLILFYE